MTASRARQTQAKAKAPKTRKKATSESGEHIFPASRLTPLAIRWKELNAAGKHKEAATVLEDIILGSTPMFERLAQYEDFHYTVDLPILVSAAQQKMVTWLLRWEPKKGRLFSWLSTCAKNSFRSELSMVNVFRRRHHVTGDNLEMFYGAEDHEVDKHDLAAEVRRSISDLTCRWGDPQEIGALRYLIECIIDDAHDRQAAVRGASYAFGISLELSRFFYDWSICALRHQFAEKAYVPFTEQDLFRAVHSYDPVLMLLEFIPWDTFKKMLVTLQGKRVRFPTLAALQKSRVEYNLHRELSRSDLDPDSVATVAKKYKKTQRSATEIFERMSQTLDPKRYGEYSIYDEPDPHA